MNEPRHQRASRRPVGASRASITARLIGAVLVPLVLMGVLSAVAVRQDLVARADARTLRDDVARLESLVDLRAALFLERLGAEVMRPEYRPPDEVLADSELGAMLLADPGAPARTVDRALAAVSPFDRPLAVSELAELRARAADPGTAPEDLPLLYDPLLERLNDALRDGGLDVRSRAVGLEEVELIRAGDDVTDAIRAPATGGLVLGALSALWVAEPAERPLLQSAVADAWSRLEEIDEQLRVAHSPQVRDRWQGSLAMPGRLRTWVDLAVAGGLTVADRPPAEPVEVGFALLEGLDWVASLDELSVLAVAELSEHATAVASDATATAWRTLALLGVVLAVSLVAATLFGRSIVVPVRRLTDRATSVGEGQLAVTPLPVDGPPEVARAARAFNDVVANLVLLERKARALARCDFDDPALDRPLPGSLGASLQQSVRVLSGSIVERAQLQRRLAHEATHDPLTGLANRSALVELIHRSLAAAHDGPPRHVAVVFIDLDGFKRTNDRFGHAAGDELLRVVAARLAGCADAGQLVGRLGGDEFLVVLPSVDGADAPLRFARRAVRAIAEPVTVAGTMLEVGASVGVALAGRSGERRGDPLDLLRRADVAVYRAKHSDDDVVLYDDELDREVARVEDIEAALELALRSPDADGLFVEYQPIVDTASGAVRGAEALARWERPGRGRVPPDVFVAVAERSGLVRELDLWVLTRVARQLREWSATPGLDALTASVNVSGRSLLAPDFVERCASVVRVSGLDPRRLTLEVTETALVTELDAVGDRLARLRELGMRVSIDDFGTGYTSVAHLRALPIDEIKIDGSFVRRLPDPEHRVLVQMMTQLAHHLRVPTVAEGVETSEHLDAVVAIGCDAIQGYLFGAPMPPAELQDWATRRRDPTRSEAPASSAGPIASDR